MASSTQTRRPSDTHGGSDSSERLLNMGKMSNSKVKVAVRVRPLNEREEGLNSECVVRVSGNQIALLPQFACKERERKEPHSFTFDNCFWTEDKHDTRQEDIFRHLGDGILENIWLGYNVCIFAYGQTGSGKTFSMMGTDDQPGIVPRICSALFEKQSSDSETFRIEASYLEIYNEEVRDLLRSAKKQKKLRVREDRLLGPYVEDLSCHAVQSYEEIKLLLDQGNKQRAIAETKMNEQSSRSHAILTLTVAQTCNDSKSGVFRELASKVSLVDLAGSERSHKSGAQGRQLKESSNINKSLSTLGLVINSLAEISENKRKSQYVNFRDSVLTWLLKNSLGGNSKTVMLATVSPAADNYQETLCTLRYADSAKRIVNQAVVNEDVKSKAMEELQQAIKRLREQLTTTEQMKEAEVKDLKSQLEEKENLLRDLKTSWEEKLKKTEVATQEWQKNLENMGVILNTQDVVFSNDSYLIQQDKQLIIHNIKATTKIGSGPSQDIQISGAEAECEHCVIRKTEDGEVFLIPVDNCQTYVNSCLSKTMTQLWHEDKIQIGSNVFILQLPNSPKPEHMKTHDSTEAEAQTYDDLNTEGDMLSLPSKRDSWNNSLIEDEKAKTDSAIPINYTTTEGLIQTIPSSNGDFSTSKKEQISHISTQICNEPYSHFINMNVNTARNTQSECLGVVAGTQVEDSTVQCSPQYGEASSQTSERLKSSNRFQNTSDLEHHPTLPSDGERRHSEGIFCWDKDTDIQWLTDLLPWTPMANASVCCISQSPGDYWKSEVQKFSTIILCHSFTKQVEWTQLEECLTHCTDTCGKRVIVIMAKVMDGDLETVREDWSKWKFSGCDLIILTRQEIYSISTNRSALQRSVAEKMKNLKEILQTERIPVSRRTVRYKMEAPVCLIENLQDGRFKVNDEAVDILSKINQPLVVVATVGMYRTGKSYMMNKLAGFQKGFELGASVQAKTKGIWMWCVPHPTMKDHALVLLDTEGLGDVQKGDKKNDIKIFGLSVLLSSVLIYNSRGTIDEDALEKLRFVGELAELIKVKSKDDEDNEDNVGQFSRHFPAFIWMVRDFTLELELDGKEITEDEYLENALLPQKCESTEGTSKKQERNRCRDALRMYFDSRKCFVFDPPSGDKKVLRRMDEVSEEELTPSFVDQCQKFCEYIYTNAKVKHIDDIKPVSGEILGHLVYKYTEAITSCSNVCMEDAVMSISEMENEAAVRKATEHYEKTMRERGRFPTETLEELTELSARCEEEALQIFIEKSFRDSEFCFNEQYMSNIEEKKKEFSRTNETASLNYCDQLIKKHSRNLEEALQKDLYSKPGGYQKFQEDMELVVKVYNSEPRKGVEAQSVLHNFIKSKENIKRLSIKNDQILTEQQKKQEEEILIRQREKMENMMQDKKAANNRVIEESLIKTCETHLTEVLKKTVIDNTQREEILDSVIQSKIKERDMYMSTGLTDHAQTYDYHIANLYREKGTLKEPSLLECIVAHLQNMLKRLFVWFF